MKTYTIWIDADGDLTLVEGTNPPKFADDTEQAPGQVMARKFEADCWTTAVDELHKFHDSHRRAGDRPGP